MSEEPKKISMAEAEERATRLTVVPAKPRYLCSELTSANHKWLLQCDGITIAEVGSKSAALQAKELATWGSYPLLSGAEEARYQEIKAKRLEKEKRAAERARKKAERLHKREGQKLHREERLRLRQAAKDRRAAKAATPPRRHSLTLAFI